MRLVAFFLSFVTMSFVFATDVVVEATEIPIEALFQMLVDLIKNWKVSGTLVSIAGIAYLIIATMKNSFFRTLWDKLGIWKTLVAPILTLIATVLTIGEFSVKTVLVALFTGVGAWAFDIIIEFISSLPFVKSAWKPFFDFIRSLLKAPVKK